MAVTPCIVCNEQVDKYRKEREDVMKKCICLLVTMLLLAGCTTTGNLGLVTKSTGDPGALLRNSQSYKELGLVEGEACRFFFLAILPWGDSSFSTAVDQALGTVGGDALMNVSVSSSLYGFIPIYNIFTYTCTNIRGIAIKFEKN
jgi:hypothetical protein